MTRWIVFSRRRLLVVPSGSGARLPREDEIPVPDRDSEPLRIGFEGEEPALAVDLGPDVEAVEPAVWMALRPLHAHVPDEVFRLAGRALQLLEWRATHRFCARCGAETRRHDVHRAMACPECGQLHFPRVSPAVIVLVERDEEMLLARSPHFPEGVYSTVAGFVEPGESLEETVRREVAEEVGVELGEMRYAGSQPWPFPHSLMVGFVAEWARGEIRIDDDEIEDARWFRPDSLPRLPPPVSIARYLIADHLRRHGRGDPEIDEPPPGASWKR